MHMDLSSELKLDPGESIDISPLPFPFIDMYILQQKEKKDNQWTSKEKFYTDGPRYM